MMKKAILSAIVFTLTGSALAQKLSISPVSPAIQLEALGMSDNHRYVTGLNTATFKGFIWDTETNNVAENEGDYANCDFTSITNDGVAYGIISVEDMVTGTAARVSNDGKVEFLDAEMTNIFSVTPDGKIAVGCTLDDLWYPTPCIWKDGERITLPYPNTKEYGYDVDGACAQYISEDGKTIAGYLLDWHSTRPAIIWQLQEDGTYKANPISKDLWELRRGQGKPYLEFSIMGMSPNGKWICLVGQKETNDDMPTNEFMIRMNLETGEITDSDDPIYDNFDPEEQGFYPTDIANDGTCIGVLQFIDGYRHGLIWLPEDKGPRQLCDMYPSVSEFMDYDYYMNNPVAISGDGNYICGYGIPLFADPNGELDYRYESYLFTRSNSDGIATITTKSLGSDRAFNLNGQRISPDNAKGLMLMQGRKVLKR